MGRLRKREDEGPTPKPRPVPLRPFPGHFGLLVETRSVGKLEVLGFPVPHHRGKISRPDSESLHLTRGFRCVVCPSQSVPQK